MASAPQPPASARAVFGSRLPIAQQYAELLADQGVLRGLIGPREVERLWPRHLLNGALLAGLVPAGASVTDVGSGAGLPGIPLVLARPDLRVTLLEPMRRRARFLSEVVADLGLPVEVCMQRAGDAPRAHADVVVARAVAPLARLLDLTMPLLRREGLLLAVKGRNAGTEVEEAAAALARWTRGAFRIERVGESPADVTVVVATRVKA